MKLDFSDDYQGCFVCGMANPRGLKLEFTYDQGDDEMVAVCTFPDYMQGYEKIVHGGFVSMVLDEVMAKACLNRKMPAVTARMALRFRKPVYINEELSFRGRIVSVRGRTVHLVSRCVDCAGTERVSAEAVFMRVD